MLDDVRVYERAATAHRSTKALFPCSALDFFGRLRRQSLFQFFARPERRFPACWNFDGLPGTRIAACAGLRLLGLEDPEPPQLYAFSRCQRL